MAIAAGCYGYRAGYGYRGGYYGPGYCGYLAVMDTGHGTETISALASRMAWLAIRTADIRATVTPTGIPPMDTATPTPITAPITVQATAAILRRRPTWAPIPTRRVAVRIRGITRPVRVAIRAADTALGRLYVRTGDDARALFQLSRPRPQRRLSSGTAPHVPVSRQVVWRSRPGRPRVR